MAHLGWWLVVLACRAPWGVAEPIPAPEPTTAGPQVCGTELVDPGPAGEALTSWAAGHGVEHPRALAGVVGTLQRPGDLPDCYLTKREASERGWERGEAVWFAVPGGAIGGDRFYNREGLLPALREPRRYAEADVDDDGGTRTAHRLVYEPGRTGDEARIWLTLDHYRSFVAVP